MRLAVIVFGWLFAVCCYAQVTPLLHGHAHNDYVHQRPLFEAIENGFTSIEIDVFLHNNKLVVSHVGVGLNSKPTIEELYFEPVKKVIEQNNGWVYASQKKPVVFMIDFKTDGTSTYEKLKEILNRYKDILTIYKGDSVVQQRAVNILISGSSPGNSLRQEKLSLATVDAGINSITNAEVRGVATRFSSSWSSCFSWRGKGEMPAEQKARLDSLVNLVHSYNKQIRFWAIPDKPAVWKALTDAGVDWINTNKLTAYRRFTEQERR
jgi:glycerophosphoryl diester phosphodiesterase